jgi:GNAT superfamily N-acetyltransferase
MISYIDSTANITADNLHGFFVGWCNPPTPETHLRLLENSDHIVLAIDIETGNVVGFITAISDGILSAYIPFLEVLPDYQKQGIGSELMHRMLKKADVTAKKVKEQGLQKVGLLGTGFTMEQDFYKVRLKTHGIDVIIPDEAQRQSVHDIIYNELCLGEIKQSSKGKFRGVIENLASSGAEGIILGCTEIPLIVKQKEYDIPLFDTTRIHAVAAVEYAIG